MRGAGGRAAAPHPRPPCSRDPAHAGGVSWGFSRGIAWVISPGLCRGISCAISCGDAPLGSRPRTGAANPIRTQTVKGICPPSRGGLACIGRCSDPGCSDPGCIDPERSDPEGTGPEWRTRTARIGIKLGLAGSIGGARRSLEVPGRAPLLARTADARVVRDEPQSNFCHLATVGEVLNVAP